MSVKNALGRGVGALLPDDIDSENDDVFFLCDIDKIEPNPQQPRSYFDPEKLEELSNSIRERGIIQPLLVTHAKGNRYHLIAGERRLRAAKMAQCEEVPVVVMDSGGKKERLELALIENIQRHDLNAIEEAQDYARLIKDFELTQQQVSDKIGKKRSTITNLLRLLKLPKKIQQDVIENHLSEGHARVLLRLQNDPKLLLEIRERILKEKLSVRETERLCKTAGQIKKNSKTKLKDRKRSEDQLPPSYCKALVTQITNRLNTKVNIQQNGGRGKVEIEYYSVDDLDRLVNLLTGGN